MAHLLYVLFDEMERKRVKKSASPLNERGSRFGSSRVEMGDGVSNWAALRGEQLGICRRPRGICSGRRKQGAHVVSQSWLAT